jgi:TetR/AcrR family hemagglutinin/protease transcriptional regulator
MAVFAARGLGEARHAQIAEVADCSLSTVFVYFPTREELVVAVLAETERALVEMAERVHGQTDKSVPAVLREHILAFTNFVESHPDYARVWLDWSTALREEYFSRYLEFQERMVGVIGESLARGQREGTVAVNVDAAEDARLVVGSAHMLAQMKMNGRPDEAVERFINTLLGAVLGSSSATS